MFQKTIFKKSGYFIKNLKNWESGEVGQIANLLIIIYFAWSVSAVVNMGARSIPASVVVGLLKQIKSQLSD